jgi:hypothetical protein
MDTQVKPAYDTVRAFADYFPWMRDYPLSHAMAAHRAAGREVVSVV